VRESKGLMGLPAPPLGYEGTVLTPAGPQHVTDGVLKVGQHSLHIDTEGTVFGPNDQPVARVVGGKLTPIQGQQQQAQTQPPQQQGQV
jgi:hypothetical protein